MIESIRFLSKLSSEERAQLLERLRTEKLQNLAAIKSDEPPLLRISDQQAMAPASFWQEQMWYLEQLMPGTPTYNVPFKFIFEGRLDVQALACALAEIDRRHDVLRTTLKLEAGKVVQVIAPVADIDLPQIDLSDYPDPAGEANRLASELARTPLDLSKGPLYRMMLLRLDGPSMKHVLLWVASHAIVDGWSVGVFVREVVSLYGALLNGGGPAMPKLPLQFRDYSTWQRKRLSGAYYNHLLSYWRRKLEGCVPLRFPTDYDRPRLQNPRGATHTLTLLSSLPAAITDLSQRLGVTPFMVLLAGYKLLLSGYSGQYDITVGTAVAGRNKPEIEPLIGSFVNTIPLRTDLSGNPTFQDYVRQVRDVTLDAFTFQELPFGKLVEELHSARRQRHNPFFQTLFVFGGVPQAQSEVRVNANLVMRYEGISSETAKFDFELAIDDISNAWVVRFDYRSDLFKPGTASLFCQRYQELLRTIAEKPGLSLSVILASIGCEPKPEPIELNGEGIARSIGRYATAARDTQLNQEQAEAKGQGPAETEPPILRNETRTGERCDSSAPSNQMETLLIPIWEELLGIGEISGDADFFALGGHSIMAAQLVARLRKEFGIDLSLQGFLESCTIRELSEVIYGLLRQSNEEQSALLDVLDRVEQMSNEEVAELLARLHGDQITSSNQ
jgi:non-ribosomal peptide synthetase component F/acyl carrier protein